MTTGTVPWTPPRGSDVEMVKVGPHWDVVRAPPAEIGERVLELLGEASGSVIADYGLMYWLIPAGHAQHWRVPVGPDRYLTDVARLREALVRATAADSAEEATTR